jgi:predicted P-loop ATPase
MALISLFKRPTENNAIDKLTVETFLYGVKSGRWETEQLNYLSGRVKKQQLPCVTPSGDFEYRKTDQLIKHSGFIALDFDEKENGDFPLDEIAADKYVYALHKSISGKGLVVWVRIEASKHLEAYLGLEKYFADAYHIIADPSGKDITRLRIVSHDPDLYENPASATFKKYIEKKRIIPSNYQSFQTESDVDFVVGQIKSKGINLVEDYHDWVRVGMGLATTYGVSGRGYFHQISAMSSKYKPEDCDKKYDNFLKTANGVTAATFFFLAKSAGCDIKTPRTNEIESAAIVRARMVGKSGGYKSKEEAMETTIKYLTEQQQIEGDDVEQIVKKVFDAPEQALKLDKANVLANIKEFLKSYDLRQNEITSLYECNGKPLTDRDVNSMYLLACESIGDGKLFSKDLLQTSIESDLSPKYNPIKSFFQQHEQMRPSGEIDKLLRSIKIKPLKNSETGETMEGFDYLNTYLRKWLLSCVASWHGTYSVMMAVLTGAQSAGKTNFFRKLLPEQLREYFADNKLDTGNKDDIIMMVTKAIICDDEFSGKSKQDYKMLKEIISKQHFTIRRPYARNPETLPRIAVLCGCSNEEEIINDPTGNRRIIPISLEEIDWKLYDSVDKTQLWMELYHEWEQVGEGWMLTKEEVIALNALTTSAMQVATEDEALNMFFQHPDKGAGMPEWMSNTAIKNYIETHSALRVSSTKLGIFLKKHGYTRVVKKYNNTSQGMYYVIKKSVPMTGANGYESEKTEELIPF